MIKNMAYSKKAFFLFFTLFSSSLHLGMFDTSLDQLLPGLGQGAFLQDAKCMQRLLPCKEYLKSPNNPSPTCCEPLKEMQENNTKCLCNFVNSTTMFQSLGGSKDEILKLPQACGINVDPSKCNNTGGGGGSQEQSSEAASEGEYAVSEAETSESTSSTKMITPHGIIYFGVPGFVALLTSRPMYQFAYC